MSHDREMPRHHAYVLRFWETRSLPPDPTSRWRFSLEDLRGDKRHKFADLESLVSFLEERTQPESQGRAGSEESSAPRDVEHPLDDYVDAARSSGALPEVSILVVEEDDAVRQSLKRWLARTLPECPIVCSEGNAAAVDLARSRAPDVILVDVAPPREDGLTVIGQLSNAVPQAAIVALTMDASSAQRQEAMGAGARGCLEIEDIRRQLVPLLIDLLAQEPEAESAVADVGREKTVVCIEDEIDMLSLIQLTLARYDINLITALGGLEGLETIERTKPDLVLLDLMMPGVDGWEVYQRMQENEATREIPVVVLTVLDPQWVERQGMDLTGVADYITKPFAPQDLAHRVGRALELVA